MFEIRCINFLTFYWLLIASVTRAFNVSISQSTQCFLKIAHFSASGERNSMFMSLFYGCNVNHLRLQRRPESSFQVPNHHKKHNPFPSTLSYGSLVHVCKTNQQHKILKNLLTLYFLKIFLSKLNHFQVYLTFQIKVAISYLGDQLELGYWVFWVIIGYFVILLLLKEYFPWE